MTVQVSDSSLEGITIEHHQWVIEIRCFYSEPCLWQAAIGRMSTDNGNSKKTLQLMEKDQMLRELPSWFGEIGVRDTVTLEKKVAKAIKKLEK